MWRTGAHQQVGTEQIQHITETLVQKTSKVLSVVCTPDSNFQTIRAKVFKKKNLSSCTTPSIVIYIAVMENMVAEQVIDSTTQYSVT